MEAKLIIKLIFADARQLELTLAEAEELYDALDKVLPPKEPVSLVEELNCSRPRTHPRT